MRLLTGVLAAAVLGLVGCAPALAPIGATEQGAPEARYPAVGMTYLHHDSGHGYQVSFLAEDQVWLWYPGNRAALRGIWGEEQVAGRAYVCFTYPRSSFNPVTQGLGGQKQCQPQELLQAHVVGVALGDVFDLSSGAVPHVLERDRRPAGI